jgi:transcriptional regulator with GAF, ATPase, and Fis domain
MFKGPDTDINLHAFSAGCPEVDRMLMFRDWLRVNPADRHRRQPDEPAREHSAILSDGALVQVPPMLLSTRVIAGASSSPSLSRAIETSERRLIEQALGESTRRVFGPTGAAARLGMPSSTLESKIKRLRINKHQYRTSDT